MTRLLGAAFQLGSYKGATLAIFQPTKLLRSPAEFLRSYLRLQKYYTLRPSAGIEPGCTNLHAATWFSLHAHRHHLRALTTPGPRYDNQITSRALALTWLDIIQPQSSEYVHVFFVVSEALMLKSLRSGAMLSGCFSLRSLSACLMSPYHSFTKYSSVGFTGRR